MRRLDQRSRHVMETADWALSMCSLFSGIDLVLLERSVLQR